MQSIAQHDKPRFVVGYQRQHGQSKKGLYSCLLQNTDYSDVTKNEITLSDVPLRKTAIFIGVQNSLSDKCKKTKNV